MNFRGIDPDKPNPLTVGLGTEERMVRDDGMGRRRFLELSAGGLAALDPGSPVNPASIAGLGGMSVQLMSETDLREYQVGAVSVDGLSSTRFPLAQLGGRIGSTALSFALSYAQYTERSYDLTNADTIEIRGTPVGFEERTTSRGGMSDLRLAFGYALPQLPHTMAGTLLTFADRFFINGLWGRALTGVYSVAAMFGMVLTLVASSADAALRL